MRNAKRYGCPAESERRAEELATLEQFNTHLKKLLAGYKSCDPIHIGDYFELVLERSEYPDGFPQVAKAAYVKESYQLVVDYELPEMAAVVPKADKFRVWKVSSSRVLFHPSECGSFLNTILKIAILAETEICHGNRHT